MRVLTLVAAVILQSGSVTALAAGPANPRLLLAFASLRDDALHPTIFFYQHDGRKTGRIVGKVPPTKNRSDHHPSLSHDGKLCMFAAEVVSTVCRIEGWNRETQQALELSLLHDSPHAQMAPTISAELGVCFEAWNRPGSPGRWDLVFYDLPRNQLLELPNLNTSRFDERKPTISGDGQWLAFTTDSPSRLSEIGLYDRNAAQRVDLPNLNSRFMDTEPALSYDGRFIALVTDRPGGQGARDIALYDRKCSARVALPGLNSIGQEQSPALSPHARYIAFVSERLEGAGERDIYVYDRATRQLLPLPGLNSPRDEYDPCLITLSTE